MLEKYHLPTFLPVVMLLMYITYIFSIVTAHDRGQVIKVSVLLPGFAIN